MRSPLNLKTAPEILRLFDSCFRRGVIEACEAEDDFAVKEWFDATFHQGKYGLVSFPEESFDWKRWRFMLLRWCREERMSTLGFDYIDGIRKVSGFQYMVIPMTMRFYLMGVQEWLEYPNELAMAFFKTNRKIHWSDKVPKFMRAFRKEDYIAYIQEFIYEFQNFPMEEMHKLGPKAMVDFEMVMWQITRPKTSLSAKLRRKYGSA